MVDEECVSEGLSLVLLRPSCKDPKATGCNATTPNSRARGNKTRERQGWSQGTLEDNLPAAIQAGEKI